MSFFQVHAPCPGCHVLMQFTGEPSANPSEDLIKQVAGDRRSVSLHWLEERIAEALYCFG